MDHITVPDGEVRDCPAVVEDIIRLASDGRGTPDYQRSEAVRLKLSIWSFEQLMSRYYSWSYGDRTPIFQAIVNDLFLA